MLRLFGKKDKATSNKATPVPSKPSASSSSSLSTTSDQAHPQRPSPSSSHATIGGKKKSGAFSRPPVRSETLPPVPPLLVTRHASATPTHSISSEASVLLTPEDSQDGNHPPLPLPVKQQQPWKAWITPKKKQDAPQHLHTPAIQSRPVSTFAPLSRPLPKSKPLEDSDDSEDEESEESDSDWEELPSRTPAKLPTVPQQQTPYRHPKAYINLRAITKNSLATPHGLPPLLYFPSVNLFPRSSNITRKLPAPQTMQSEMFKKRLLRKLNARQLTAAEAASIAPFASRSKPQPPMPSPKPNSEEVVSDLGKVAGDGYSRGLRNWIQRPCFEERTIIWLAGQEHPQRVTTRPDLALADLEFSSEVEGLAGLYIGDTAAEPPAVTPSPPALLSPVTQTGPTTRKEKRGVRFSVQVDQQEHGKQSAMPLGLAMAKQREREERQKRMLEERQARQRMVQEEKEKEEKRLAAEERRQKKYAEMIAASRTRRELQRAPGALGETHARRELEELQRLPPPPPLFGSDDSRSHPRTPVDSPASKMKQLPAETAEISSKVSINNPRRESAPSMSRTPYGNPMLMMPYSLSATSLPMQMQQPWAMQPGFMYDPMLAASMTMGQAQMNAMFTGEGLRPWVNGHGRTGSSTPPSSSSPGMTPPGSFAGSSSEDVRQPAQQRGGYFGPQGSTEDLRHGKSGSGGSNYERGRSSGSRPANAPRAPSSTRSVPHQPRSMTMPISRESGHHRDSTYNGRENGKWVQQEDPSKYVGSLGRSQGSRPMSTAAPPTPSPLKPGKPSRQESQDSHRSQMTSSGSTPALPSSSSRGHLPLPNSFRPSDMPSNRSISEGNLASRPSGLRNSFDGRAKPQQPPPTAFRTAPTGYTPVPSGHPVPGSWNMGTLNTSRTVVQ